MPLPPSNSDPRHNRLRASRSRALRPPHERFSDVEVPESANTEPPVPDPLAQPNYTEEELEWRRLSPAERRRRAKNARARQQVERQAAHQKLDEEDVAHRRRAAAQREFAQHAREDVPLPPEAVKVKKRQPIWKIAKRLALVLLILAAGQLVVASLTAPQFKIRDVDTSGLNITPASQVEPLARLLVGQNVVRARTGAVESALEKLPTVADAHVVRLFSWPPKATVVITERQPFVKVGAGSEWWAVDQSGVPFQRISAQDDAQMYAVTSPKLEPKLGRPLPAKDWGRVAELVTALQDDNQASGNAWRLRRVYFDEHGAAALRVQGPAPGQQHDELLIRLGEEGWEAKLVRARQTLDYFDRTGRRAESLDLVSYERPLWHPKPEPKTTASTGVETDTNQNAA